MVGEREDGDRDGDGRSANATGNVIVDRRGGGGVVHFRSPLRLGHRPLETLLPVFVLLWAVGSSSKYLPWRVKFAGWIAKYVSFAALVASGTAVVERLRWQQLPLVAGALVLMGAVSYTHLTLPTNREV